MSIHDFELPHPLYSSDTYYVRCTDNNCYSDWSNALHVEVLPTSNPCNDPDLDEVNEIHQVLSRVDNHYYHRDSVVCYKQGNPNCTREKVFETLLKSKSYSVPITSDLPGVPLLGSTLLFNDDTSPVDRNKCATVNLPSGSAVIVNLLTLIYGIGTGNPLPYFFSYEATALNPIANPIGQYVDGPNYSVINYTKKTHVFYPGRVVRTIKEDCNSVKVVTIGIGNSRVGPSPLGQEIAEFNKKQGQNIFRNADIRLINAFNQSYK